MCIKEQNYSLQGDFYSKHFLYILNWGSINAVTLQHSIVVLLMKKFPTTLKFVSLMLLL